MELAVSNIAWLNEEDVAIAEKLRDLGVHNIEIAPTKIWDDPTTITSETAMEYVNWWAGYGIKVSAFQSMLFARPDLKIFESDSNRQETINYMSKFIKLAGIMGSKKMVFGSPKNRQLGEISAEQANQIAIIFFNELGNVALKNNVTLCLEPNAHQYNCDFITNANEGNELVRIICNPGIGLHLDTACMSLAGDNIEESIKISNDILEHFHISSPMLGQVDRNDGINHKIAADALRSINYDKIVSIEMRSGGMGTNVERVERAVRFAQKIYLNY